MAEAEDGLVDVAHGVEAVGRADEAMSLACWPLVSWNSSIRMWSNWRLQAGAGLGDVLQQADGELLEVGEIERAGLPFALAVEAVEAAQHFDAAFRAAGRSAR